MSIGENLRYYRKVKGFTQENLAEGICHTTYISKIENGSISPPKETLKDLCSKLGISLELLIQNEDKQNWLLLNGYLKSIKDSSVNSNRYNDLKNSFKKIENPFLLCHYYTIQLLYCIILKDKSNAESAFKKIRKLDTYVKEEYKYEYFLALGLYEYHYGNLQTSYTYYLQAEQHLDVKELEDPELFYYIALVLSKINNVSLSTMYIYKSLELYNSTMNFNRIIDCNLLLGINLNHMKEYDKSEEYFLKIINLPADNRELQTIKGRAYHNLANIYSKQGNSVKAIEMLHKSILFKEDSEDKSNTFYLLSREYFTINEFDLGEESLSKGFELAKKANNKNYLMKLNVLYYKYFGDSLQYTIILKDAINHFKSIDISYTYKCAESLAEIQASNFHYKEAYETLKATKEMIKS